jgi:hypothetical protein
MLKHVGRISSTKRKVIVAYKVLPGEPDDCVVVTTENLEAGDHDTLIKLVESAAGQEAEDLATVMMRTTLSDGSNMLARFHQTGKMIKTKTANVEMIPNRNTTIMLNELNEVIAQQRGVTVADLALKDSKGNTVPVRGSNDPVLSATQVAGGSAPANDGVMTDEVLAKKFRSDADRLSKEAAELRRQAEELVPTKKKAAPKKTAASA